MLERLFTPVGTMIRSAGPLRRDFSQSLLDGKPEWIFGGLGSFNSEPLRSSPAALRHR